VVPHAKLAPVVDLMAALKQSLKSKDEPKKALLRAVPDKIEKKSRKAG
jgi:non-homologous end joining protein Ku